MRCRYIWHAWLLWSLAVSAAWLNLSFIAGSPEFNFGEPPARLGHALYLVQPLLIATVALIIATRRPGNRVGWLLLVGGTAMALQGLAQTLPGWPMASSLTNGLQWAAWVSNWAWAPAETTLAIALVLFPTGRLPSPAWRPVVIGMVVAGLAMGLIASALPGPLESAPNFENPLGLGGAAGEAVAQWAPLASSVISPIELVAAAASVLFRFSAARGEERQQLKWLAYALGIGATVSLANAFRVFGLWGDVASNVALAGVPVAIGLALLRYRLYEIDLLINRTLVYGVLTIAIGAVYVVVVGYVGAALQVTGPAALLVTGGITIVFQPMRRYLQRVVNRLMYGHRDEPYTAISRLNQRLEASTRPGSVLTTIVQAVRDSLKLPYAAVEMTDGAGQTSLAREASGTPLGDPVVLPLIYQREHVGELVVSPRAAGEVLGPADRRLLEDLARQAGVAAHAVRLTAELQRSRERLVNAREEERRRLRRDLHDGLGPTLAALSLKLETARNLLSDDGRAVELLDELAGRAQAAVGDIRRLVYGLRPPALDDLGLVQAVRQQVDQYLGSGMDVRLEAPTEMASIPAAVEVAAYRIVAEALTNVVRHAAAHRCMVRLAQAEKSLIVEVEDDGAGLHPDRPVGVGLASMRERAEELGGSLSVNASVTGGTCVRATLPLPL